MLDSADRVRLEELASGGVSEVGDGALFARLLLELLSRVSALEVSSELELRSESEGV